MFTVARSKMQYENRSLGSGCRYWPTRSGTIGVVDIVPGVDLPGLNMAVGYGECFAPAPENDPLIGDGTRWARG